jgi:3-methylcrotonyl-CoA carboxylase beta subunit
MRPTSTLKLIGKVLSYSQRCYHASVLPSSISSVSPEFVAKAEAMDSLVAQLDSKMAEARLGGGAKAEARMRSKGKKLPRERSGFSRLGSFLCLFLTSS